MIVLEIVVRRMYMAWCLYSSGGGDELSGELWKLMEKLNVLSCAQLEISRNNLCHKC